MPTTTWLAATTGQPPLAQQINQLLVTHPATYLYTATIQSSVTTNGATTTGTNNLWLAESFTTTASQTAIGYILAPISTTTTTGTSLAPTTLSLYANSAGAPSGAALVSVTITAEYAFMATSGNTNLSVVFPLPITGLTPSTTYWLVLHSTTSTGQFTWFRSASASGASTSPNGTTWTAQAYGLRYRVFDQSTVAPLIAVWEDNGVRWESFQYVANTELLALSQYTSGQTTPGYNQGYRAVSNTNGLPQKVT